MIGYFDGACWPNPNGIAGAGWCLIEDEQMVEYGFGKVGEGEGMTNNVAEFVALRELLLLCLNQKKEIDCIYGDSLLVINCVSGRWKTKKTHLKPLMLECRNLLRNFSCPLIWMPREYNTIADELSNLGRTNGWLISKYKSAQIVFK